MGVGQHGDWVAWEWGSMGGGSMEVGPGWGSMGVGQHEGWGSMGVGQHGDWVAWEWGSMGVE